jgi:sugar-specific transcriptional regulator TrmB
MKEEIMKKLVEEMIRRVMNVEDRAAKLEAELQRRQKEDLYAAADNSNLISLILSSLSLSLLCLSAYLC